VRVRLDHVASLIVNANHCIMGTAETREMVRDTGQAGDLTFSAANSRRLNLFLLRLQYLHFSLSRMLDSSERGHQLDELLVFEAVDDTEKSISRARCCQ
jgi:hypothetical protein